MFLDKKLVIFDLDGTLIDSLGIWSKVDAALVEELTNGRVRLTDEEAYELRRSSLSVYGEGSEAYFKYCADIKEKFQVPDLTREEIHSLRYSIAQRLLRTAVNWIDGAPEFVLELKRRGLKLALCTTTRRRNVEIYSRENELLRSRLVIEDAFDAIVTRDDVEKTKPDPEAHGKILDFFGFDAKDALMIEDAATGCRAARAAGIPVAAVKERHSAEDEDEIRGIALKMYSGYAQMLEDLAAEEALRRPEEMPGVH